MLEIYNTFAESNHTYFYARKTMRVKFREANEHEKALPKET